MATVADFSRARVHAGVTAAEARRLAEAETAAVALDDLGGRRLNGLINSVARISDPTTGTYAVEIWLDGEGCAPARGHAGHGPPALRRAAPTIWPCQTPPYFAARAFCMCFWCRTDGPGWRPSPLAAPTAGSSKWWRDFLRTKTVVTDGQFALRDGAPVRVVEGD